FAVEILGEDLEFVVSVARECDAVAAGRPSRPEIVGRIVRDAKYRLSDVADLGGVPVDDIDLGLATRAFSRILFGECDQFPVGRPNRPTEFISLGVRERVFSVAFRVDQVELRWLDERDSGT